MCSGLGGVEKWRLGTSCAVDPKGPSLSPCRVWGLEGGGQGRRGTGKEGDWGPSLL